MRYIIDDFLSDEQRCRAVQYLILNTYPLSRLLKRLVKHLFSSDLMQTLPLILLKIHFYLFVHPGIGVMHLDFDRFRRVLGGVNQCQVRIHGSMRTALLLKFLFSKHRVVFILGF